MKASFITVLSLNHKYFQNEESNHNAQQVHSLTYILKKVWANHINTIQETSIYTRV